MKKNIYIIICLIGVTFSSCNDWFNVTAPSEIRKEDHFSTVTGFQQSLIGCYISMTDNALYGTNLSWFATESMAHQFRLYLQSDDALGYLWQSHKYMQTLSQPEVEKIWEKAYNVIANVNDELSNIEEKKSVLDDINYHIIKGELLAIRAYVHFDILRLYGHGNWNQRFNELDDKLTIPYVTVLSKDLVAQRSYTETFNLLLEDLENASSLLKDYDPITGVHDASFYSEQNGNGFLSDRTLRLNYYAVKALQARVYLWRGNSNDIKNALSAAEEVINALGKGIDNKEMYTYCSFITPEKLNASYTSLSRENIFGLNVSDLATRTTDYIKSTYINTDAKAMYLVSDEAEELYENSATDVRITTLMRRNNSATITGYVPLKVYQGELASDFKNRVSMIRLPEVYYISAECYVKQVTPDLTLALNRLNSIREKRGVYTPLENLTAPQIINEIQKEYHKEFLSEGVMFYYYKRTGATYIPNYNEAMGDAQYVLPYPEFELQSGRIQ